MAVRARPGRGPAGRAGEGPGDGPGAPPGRRPARAVALALFALITAVNVVSPTRALNDTAYMTYLASAIAHHGTLELDRWAPDPLLPQVYTLETQDGHLLSAFPWAPALFEVPVVLVGDGIRALRGAPPLVDDGPRTPEGGVTAEAAERTLGYQGWTAAIVVALTALVLRAVVLEVSTSRWRHALGAGAALFFAFATPTWGNASRMLWTHGPVMLLFSLAMLLAVTAERSRLRLPLMGVVLGAAYTVRPTSGVVILPLAAWVLYRHRRALPGFVAGVAAVLVPWVVVTERFYGSAFQRYYSSSRVELFEPHVPEGLLGTLVSPSRGLFVVCPALVLAFVGVTVLLRRRRLTALHLALMAGCAGHWVAIGSFTGWSGGAAYGARLMEDIVPILIVLAVPALDAIVDLRPGLAKHVLVVPGVAVLVATSLLLGSIGVMRSSACWREHAISDWSWRRPQWLGAIKTIERDGWDGLRAQLDEDAPCDTVLV